MNKVTLSITIVLLFAVSTLFSHCDARPLLNDHSPLGDGGVTAVNVYETAKYNLAFWLQRLASGPSDGGAGH
ncbi:hypothetical protein RND81_05G125500 [Saponaria officinalis]|uniref:Uncharacterized protein n=1 Tax=Saponaria officinalis TaxID=3572 RepID=A0AAW1L0F5_SAPOF